MAVALPKKLSASLVGSRVIYSHQPHAVYDIEVRYAKSKWIVSRRFSQFYALQQALSGKVPGPLPALPAKTWFPNLTPEFLQSRLASLQKFVDALARLVDMNSDVQKFLNFDQSSVPACVDPTLAQFNVLSLIGKGAYGTVFQVVKKDTGAILAMKVIKKSLLVQHNEVEHALNERRILGTIDNPFVLRLRYSFQTPDKLFILQDYCVGGCLFYHLGHSFPDGRLPEHVARHYLAEITLALDYLHSQNILYRDLKSENVLLDAHGHVQLTDFGLSKVQVNLSPTRTSCGTLQYLAPEVVKSLSARAKGGEGAGYGQAIDWWALGVLAFQLISGQLPFNGDNAARVYASILLGKDKVIYPKHVSVQAKEFISCLLESDPELRTRNVADLKKCSFFENVDWTSLARKEVVPPFIPPTPEGNSSLSNVHENYRNRRVPAKWFGLCAGEGVRDNLFPDFTYSCEWFEDNEPSSPVQAPHHVESSYLRQHDPHESSCGERDSPRGPKSSQGQNAFPSARRVASGFTSEDNSASADEHLAKYIRQSSIFPNPVKAH